ncbi:hypothetical protein Rfer_4280 (plasmid) [Rhodoferax ferrireducens T118]|uniref:DUF1845 domain-containing protein n=2 Tax=Rhodoferax ferrireducens TaxID=192843 RepID=Q21QH8_ALBFT|nr:hypothetical protein Rfer_4280 [Rhodoferax ferrireducens T118]
MTAVAEKQQQPRVQPSPGDRHATLIAANMKAKTQFADKYEGASIRLKTILHNRPVIRSFKRIFNISMRNWYIATSVPRASLGDASLASQVEAGMLKKIGETIEYFKKQIKQCEIVAADGEVDFALISHGAEFTDDTRVIGPVAMQLRQLFLMADHYLDLTQALYSFAQITGDEANNASYEVKKRLEAASTSIRNFRRLSLEKVNDSGKNREGFKAVAVDGDQAGQLKDALPASDEAGNVVGIASAGVAETPAGAPAEPDEDSLDTATNARKAA